MKSTTPMYSVATLCSSAVLRLLLLINLSNFNMSTGFKPFSVRTGVTVVEGGWLNRPWCPELINIGDKEFYKFSTYDRGFAKAIGLDVGTPNMFRDVELFRYLVELRDDQVDDMIGKKLMEDDPMGQKAATRITRGREKAFNDAAIPQIVEITVPPFKSVDGVDVPQEVIKVQSTARRGHALCFEITDSSMEFCAHAVRVSWEKKRKRVSVNQYTYDLPKLPTGLKYRRRGDALSICCKYCNAEGEWKTHQETVAAKRIDTEDHMNVLIVPVVASMTNFLQENDYPEVAQDCEDEECTPSKGSAVQLESQDSGGA